MKKNFLIKTIEDKEECKKQIDLLDINDNVEVVIYQQQHYHTLQQTKLFYKLLNHFVKVANESGLGGVLDNDEEWWKYQVKIRANFFEKKGCLLFTQERLKEINNEIKVLSKNVRQDIIKAITFEVKSIKEATQEEIIKLINHLLILIIYYLPQELIKTDEFLSEKITKTYNYILNKDIIRLEEQYLLMMMQDKLKFIKKNGQYYLM